MKGSKREEKPRRKEILKTITVAAERRIPSSKMIEQEGDREREREDSPLWLCKTSVKPGFPSLVKTRRTYVLAKLHRQIISKEKKKNLYK